MTKMSVRSLVAMGALLAALPALAADAGRVTRSTSPFFSEVRLGVFAHDPWSPEKGSADVNGELLFAKPFQTNDHFWNVFIPRPHIGGTVNFASKTSHGYVGLTWTYDVTSRFFIEGSFGAAVHNGETGRVVPVNRNAMGCALHFRESASLGFRLTENWSVMGTVEHISNAGLCRQNRGLTNAGVRLGYTF